MLSFELAFNSHKLFYEQYTERAPATIVGAPPTDKSAYTLHVYPDTPVGFVLYTSAEMAPLLEVIEQYQKGER